MELNFYIEDVILKCITFINVNNIPFICSAKYHSQVTLP